MAFVVPEGPTNAYTCFCPFTQRVSLVLLIKEKVVRVMIPAPGGGLSYDEAEELSKKEEGEKGMALMQAEQRAAPLVERSSWPAKPKRIV
ncbi:MAG: hypothetical protein ACQET7_14995 [Thermodesulfobacteriota bacterium]